VSPPAILNRENKRRNVRDYAGKLAQIVLHNELKQDSLLEKWKNLSTEQREEEFFASLKTMTDNGNEASQTRNECVRLFFFLKDPLRSIWSLLNLRRVPEVTLERMTSNEGEGFIDLVNHFVENFKKNLTDSSWDIYQPLKNEVYDRIYMLDQGDDAKPLPKGIRAFQGELLFSFVHLLTLTDGSLSP
jgi:hypothetical protein